MKYPMYTLSAKCEQCNQTTIHVVTKAEQLREDGVEYIIYRDLCLACWHNGSEFPTTNCRTTKEGWGDFILSSLN